jgi:peptide/nickel transport system substrate-binding protein
MRRALALAAAGVAAIGVLGAASAAPQRYGGTLVIGLSGGEPSSLDPTFARGTGSVMPAMCEQLYAYDARLRLVPVLAAAVPALSADRLSYTVQLRQGILFNDGTPFNAQAVVTTVQRFMTAPGSSRASDYASVDSVKATGPYTVVFHLATRDSTFAANPQVLSPAQLAKLGDNFESDPVCVGPFMFDHRDVGVDITLIKSPYYYDKGDVFLDKLVFKPMTDAAAAVAALEAGDIQVLDNVSTADLQDVQQNSSLRVLQAFQLGWAGILVNIGNKNGLGNLPYANVGTPLASSPNLRKAFEEAIDRNLLNKVVFNGLEQVTCTPIPPADTPWYAATAVPCTAYNPTDARRLVAASGSSNPTVHLLTNLSTDNLRRAQFIQAEEAAVGFNVVIDALDPSTVTARRIAGNFDAYVGGFTPGGVDPTIPINLATTDARNYGGYSSTRLDYVLANGLKATDPKARAVNYQVAQQIIHDDRPYIPLYNPSIFAAVSASVAGVQLDYRGLLALTHARYK